MAWSLNAVNESFFPFIAGSKRCSRLWPMKSKGEISNFLLTSVNNSTQSKPLLANISFRFRCQDNHVPRWTGRNFFLPPKKPRQRRRRAQRSAQGEKPTARWKDRWIKSMRNKAEKCCGLCGRDRDLRPCARSLWIPHTHTRVHTPTHSCGQ